ncbi:hypothetical protein FUA23_18610 [Neolewinella aurantiaca]|uniref:DUF4129 domain-containing protein n=1 Tax=Neolewinella aurantiaca TaxID=2602767 RepID=A0A5C7FQX7_9BACT|nr:DUF4129 domain-containing protein [Neolewinella aurantiaca]TXF87105.1 hypothetical protein FUA23_18610 [Neolewinella aurantiaca]
MHQILRHFLLRIILRSVPQVRLLVLAGVGLGFHPLVGQQAASPVFPADRHKELMDDLSFVKEKEEEEIEEEVEEEDPFDWFDSLGSYENWKIDLSDGTTLLILAILIAGLGYLIYRMLGDVDMRKRTKGKEDDQDEINISEIEEEQLVAEGVSLTLLQRAENAGQFDIAVRLLYIQLLKELQDGGLIRYRRDFSNRDYQNQLRRSDFLQDFREVTADYERYWYGKYPIERLSYRLVHRKFTTLNAAIQAATAKSASHE